MATHDEGVTKFSAVHEHHDGPVPIPPDVLSALTGWRALLHDLRLIGQDPARYGGAGFGNVSARTRGQGTEFWVSGTQTGGRRLLGAGEYALVMRHDVRSNRVWSRGPVPPSSESMTHGTLYEHGRPLRFVLHVHSPVMWRAAARLGIPRTPAHVAYGTPEMARAVDVLFHEGPLRRLRVFSMDGHEDGIIAFGATADEAGSALMTQLARAHAPGF